MLFTHHKVRIEPCPGLREGDDFGVVETKKLKSCCNFSPTEKRKVNKTDRRTKEKIKAQKMKR
jgi:hypothetical protein